MSVAAEPHLGVDVGGTRIKWSIVVQDESVRRGDVATSRTGGGALVDQIVDLVQAVGHEARSVGLAMPGLVDTRERQTLVVPNIPGAWSRYPLAHEVETRTGTPVVLINDARAFGYAEFHAGAGRGCGDALFLTIGTGIGGALAQGGRVLIGDIDCMPEMGHVAVEMHGELCGCGATGCLETVASAPAVVARCVRAVLAGQSPILTELCGGQVENLSAEMVARAADGGDAAALSAFERAGTFIGMAAASCCVMLRTSSVIVGGGLAGAFLHLAPWIARVIDARSSIAGPVALLPAQLGSHAGALGAGLYAQHRAAARADRLEPTPSRAESRPRA